VNSKEEKIDANQHGVNIGLKILNQISKRLVDQNDKKDGRKIIEEWTYPPRFAIGSQFQSQKEAYPHCVAEDQRSPKGKFISEEKNQNEKTDEKEQG